MLKILIADDHALMRLGIKQILVEALRKVEVTEVASGLEALRLVMHQKFDVAILDIAMPGRSGLDVLKDIKLASPDLPVLILSMHPEDQFAVRVLKAGASGFVPKQAAPQMLVKAVQKVMAGGRFLTETAAEMLASQVAQPQSASPHEALSQREYEVLCGLASGLTVSGIAGTMNLSVKTVSTYRARILQKLNLENNAQLTRYALDNKLV